MDNLNKVETTGGFIRSEETDNSIIYLFFGMGMLMFLFVTMLSSASSTPNRPDAAQSVNRGASDEVPMSTAEIGVAAEAH